MNKAKYCNHKDHTAVTVCSRCGGPVCERCWYLHEGKYVCRQCRKKTGFMFSTGFVCLVGLILFFVVFTGIVVFGSQYVASDSNLHETDMNFHSACLWLNENGDTALQSYDRSIVEGEVDGVSKVELEKTLSDGTVACLRPFINLKELKQFLNEDLTDEHVYSRDFDCDDFAFMLSQHAINKGYQIFPFAEDNHLKNVAHVAMDDAIAVYTIEPQTDEVRLWGKID
jgi:hypothetical protein